MELKTPLIYGEGSDREWYINDADGYWIAEAVPAGNGKAEEVARRIVACVNACAGISTEELEQKVGIVASSIDSAVGLVGVGAEQCDKLRADLVALSMERDMRRMAEQSNAKLIAELAEAKKSADFNFEQYQDAGRLLFEVCEQRDLLLAVLKELLSGQTIEGLRGQSGMMDICVTGEDVRAGLEAIAAVEQATAAPSADADGWIEWNGGECPVDSDAGVEVKFRNGAINKKCLAFVWRWDHGRGNGDIIAYRVVQGGAA